MVSAGFKTRIAILGILFLGIIAPAYAGNVASDIFVNESSLDVSATPTATAKIDPWKEFNDAKLTEEYQKHQWSVTNFEYVNGSTTFWIENENRPDINMNDLKVTNHDTGEEINFTMSEKVDRAEKKPTASIWNLFGLLDPQDRLSKGQMLSVRLDGDYLNVVNVNVTYMGLTITHYGNIEE